MIFLSNVIYSSIITRSNLVFTIGKFYNFLTVIDLCHFVSTVPRYRASPSGAFIFIFLFLFLFVCFGFRSFQ